jgi:branched-chain amino acid transport system permease protein
MSTPSMATPPPAATMSDFAASPVVTEGGRAARTAAVLALFAVAAVVSLPWWGERAHMHLATEFFYVLALAQMWNLLAGYGGLLSVGQQAFVGIGAYSLVLLGLHGGLNAFLVIPLAGVAGAVMGALVAPLVFRLRGAHFAVGTWVIAEVLRILTANLPFVSGGSGTSVARTVASMGAEQRISITLWIALALGVGATLAVYALLRSRWGLALVAVRDSERASQSLGIDPQRLKWLVWIAAAAGCAMVGALIFTMKLRVSPDAAYSLDWTTTMLFVVVIGGIGTLEGPIVGTVVYFLLREWLSDLGEGYLILLGALTMAVMLFAKGGLWGLVTRRWDVQLFPVQRRVKAG